MTANLSTSAYVCAYEVSLRGKLVMQLSLVHQCVVELMWSENVAYM